MIMLVFLFLFMASACETRSAPFIIGPTAKNATKGEFPYIALIQKDGNFICGGTLLSRRTVLTAAHCAESDLSASYSVVLGEHDRTTVNGTEQTIAVTEIRFHRDYTVDMAILVLEKPAVLNKWVQTAQLAEKDYINGYPVTAVGWGWTKPEVVSMASVLRKVTLPLQSAEACMEDGLWIDNEKNLCAGYTIYNTYVNVCHRDSGSPFIVKDCRRCPHKIVGMVQGGHRGCPKDKHMAIFVRITYFRDWILENMKIGSSGDAYVVHV